jgi:hypothetical protein
MDLRKRKMELDMIEVEAMERRQSAMTRLGVAGLTTPNVAELTTPTVAFASAPKTNAAINFDSSDDSAEELYERITARRNNNNKTPQA